MARKLIERQDEKHSVYSKIYWQYGEFFISKDYFGFQWSHKEYDGPEDNRIGNEATVELCVEAIEEWYADQDANYNIAYHQKWHYEYSRAAMFHREIGELSRAARYQYRAAECFRIIEIWRD